MTKRRVERAIILAAGRGSRLALPSEVDLPKPLKPVAGTALIVRILRTLAAEGLREAVVVVGYESARLREALAGEFGAGEFGAGFHPGLTVTFVDNPDWEKSNGVSVVAAGAWIDRECVLAMADHLIAPELVRHLVRADLPPGRCALGVDFDIDRCFDLDDATKVRVEGAAIEAIGKDLEDYNAIDTGVFRVGPALVAELRAQVAARGDASLSDGVRALAARGDFLAVDVGDARWIDVDTPEALARAEAMVRVFGDALGDPLADGAPLDPEAMELFSPTWVRGASPYREDHFSLADREGRSRRGEFARLMSNESPFAPSPRVTEAVLRVLTRGHLYPDAALARELRTRLAGAAEGAGSVGAGAGLTGESCVLGAGSSEIIDLLVRTFVAPGEEVVVAVPTFSMYESRARVAGGVPVIVPMRDELDLDVSALLAAVTERTKLIFLCSPNNPTGRRVDDAALRRILRIGIPTAVDEAYVEFGDDDRSVAGMIPAHPNLVVVRTFSKAFGLAGLRIGYALACEPVARLLARVKLPWNVSTVALAAALAALDDEAGFARQRDLVRAERRYLRAELGAIPGVEVFESDGNFLLLDIHETGHSADALVQLLLQDGVYIRSLASHHLRRGYVRVSVGSHDDNHRCVEALRRAVLRARPRAHTPAVH